MVVVMQYVSISKFMFEGNTMKRCISSRQGIDSFARKKTSLHLQLLSCLKLESVTKIPSTPFSNLSNFYMQLW